WYELIFPCFAFNPLLIKKMSIRQVHRGRIWLALFPSRLRYTWLTFVTRGFSDLQPARPRQRAMLWFDSTRRSA
ncbi:hypothetical protein OF83DRAFT_1138011, partial [Amylostereum chailletii]